MKLIISDINKCSSIHVCSYTMESVPYEGKGDISCPLIQFELAEGNERPFLTLLARLE